jgi:hypothetical protein
MSNRPTTRTRRISFDINESEAPKWEPWLRESKFDLIGFLLRPDDDDAMKLLEDCGIKVVRNSTLNTYIDFAGMEVGDYVTVFELKGTPTQDKRTGQVRTRAWHVSRRLAPKKFAARSVGNEYRIMRVK